MEKDKIMVVGLGEKIANNYKNLLQEVFEGQLTVDWILANDSNIKKIYDYPLLIFTTYGLLRDVQNFINPNVKILKAQKMISPQGINKIKKLPHGSSALVYNVGPKSAAETIHLVYSIGRTDLDLRPGYPSITLINTNKIDYVITQGEEVNNLDNNDIEIIDIGDTGLDIQIYLDIMMYFKLDTEENLKKIMEHFEFVDDNRESLSFIINQKFLMESVVNKLFENLNEGAVIFDEEKRIQNVSSSVSKLLGKSVEFLIGEDVRKVLPIEKILSSNSEKENILTVNGELFVCTIIQSMLLGKKKFGFAILKKYENYAAKLDNHKQALLKSGFSTKYSRVDLIGESEEITEVKYKAIRMAKSESTVLITGESGTGKEVIAHVIHNNSSRFDKKFIAINCASIPENLLESELFGYEAGAFTGAVKGGKKGIFEIANGGTLFLDEIYEIPLHLQNRLLRVLQEKEVTPVGAAEPIPIDIRIICATHENLKKRVEENKFRRDLFYRINVLPIHIPPLRERGNDSILIFKFFLEKCKSLITLDKSAENLILKYSWEGNIRELKNCVEFLINLDKEHIMDEDFPDYILDDLRRRTKETYPSAKKIANETTIKKDFVNEKIRTKILEIIKSGNGKGIGRQIICSKLKENNHFVAEQKVRDMLLELQEEGLIVIHRGRSGCKLTEIGEGLLQS